MDSFNTITRTMASAVQTFTSKVADAGRRIMAENLDQGAGMPVINSNTRKKFPSCPSVELSKVKDKEQVGSPKLIRNILERRNLVDSSEPATHKKADERDGTEDQFFIKRTTRKDSLSRSLGIEKNHSHHAQENEAVVSDVNTVPSEREICIRLLEELLNQHAMMYSKRPPQPSTENRLDSLADIKLEENSIQVTINLERKRNILSVSIHRVNVPLTSWVNSSKIFAKLSILPQKSQKQRSRDVDPDEAQIWEEDFVFKKLTIGELEDCSIQIKIYAKKKFPKSAEFIGKAIIPLSSVNIDDFNSTIGKLDICNIH